MEDLREVFATLRAAEFSDGVLRRRHAASAEIGFPEPAQSHYGEAENGRGKLRTSEPAKSPSSGLSATCSPWNGEKGLCDAREGAAANPSRSAVTGCRIQNNSETGVQCTEETRHGVSGHIGELQKQIQNAQATPQPKLLDRLRDKMRLLHYSIRTESAYSDWITRYFKFHRQPTGAWRHPAELGSADIEKFLTYLAVESKVSASTQNQGRPQSSFSTNTSWKLIPAISMRFGPRSPIDCRRCCRFLKSGGFWNSVPKAVRFA